MIDMNRYIWLVMAYMFMCVSLVNYSGVLCSRCVWCDRRCRYVEYLV